MAKVREQQVMRTRERILNASAELFADRGYAATSVNDILTLAAEDGEGMSPGRLYQQFPNKKAIAREIIARTLTMEGVRDQTSRLQEWVDTGLILSHRFQLRDPYGRRLRDGVGLRAALRLSLDPAMDEDYGEPWAAWLDITTGQLAKAQLNNELLPYAEPATFARQLAGYWAGLALVGHGLDKNHDRFEQDISTLYGNLLTNLAIPALIPRIDVSDTRGRSLWERHQQEQEAHEPMTPGI
ncbi:TetR family transcriptional regulator [Streptomyces sp. NPDC004296]|uniref:TetR family transcriptional regulator n=1 Tax=Streptomyces sp. NPDC004296 TaxID=3364697 RepID=UPI0036B6FA15